jgi:hypothetical protein
VQETWSSLVASLGGVFLVVGAGLTIVAIRHFSRRRAFIRGSSVATGVVVANREERDGTDIQLLGYPQVRFQAASGREITFESRMARGSGAWSVGESVSVRYLVADPEIAELDSFVALWGATAAFAALALVFLAVGLSLWIGLIPG